MPVQTSNPILNQMFFWEDQAYYTPQVTTKIIVEGKTDLEFYKAYSPDTASYYAYDEFVISLRNLYNTQLPQYLAKITETPNNKENIKTFVRFQKILFRENTNFRIVGIIDLDNNHPYNYIHDDKIFLTDTSDLETLLLKTDKNLLNKVFPNCNDGEQIKTAFKLAYQFALLKKLFYAYARKTNICEKISFNSLLKDRLNQLLDEEQKFINIPKTFKSLFNILKDSFHNRRHTYNKSNRKSLINHEYLDVVRQYLNIEKLTWKTQEFETAPNQLTDFWNTVNGHILLKFINIKIGNNNANKANYYFEYELINKYERKCFYSTSLADKLQEQQIISHAETT